MTHFNALLNAKRINFKTSITYFFRYTVKKISMIKCCANLGSKFHAYKKLKWDIDGIIIVIRNENGNKY